MFYGPSFRLHVPYPFVILLILIFNDMLVFHVSSLMIFYCFMCVYCHNSALLIFFLHDSGGVPCSTLFELLRLFFSFGSPFSCALYFQFIYLRGMVCAYCEIMVVCVL